MKHTIFCSLISILLVSCTSVKRSVEINAPASVVWKVLISADDYKAWNPFFTAAKGKFTEGEKISLTMKPEGKKPLKFSPKIIQVTPDKMLQWRGRVLIPGMFDGKHTFTVDSISPGHTVFTQQENFSGLLVPFLNKGPFIKGWEKINQALKSKAEAKRD